MMKPKDDTLTKRLAGLTERLRHLMKMERETLGEIRKIRQQLDQRKP